MHAAASRANGAQDIAFKILDRKWFFGYSSGFRCQYINNVFQLWFRYQRDIYRR